MTVGNGWIPDQDVYIVIETDYDGSNKATEGMYMNFSDADEAIGEHLELNHKKFYEVEKHTIWRK